MELSRSVAVGAGPSSAARQEATPMGATNTSPAPRTAFLADIAPRPPTVKKPMRSYTLVHRPGPARTPRTPCGTLARLRPSHRAVPLLVNNGLSPAFAAGPAG